MLKRLLLGCLLAVLTVSAVIAKPLSRTDVLGLAKRLQQEWVIQNNRLLLVDVPAQKLYVVLGGSVKYVYSISSSKFGVGSKSGSYKTPRGMHRVSDKFGDDAPLGTIFKARINTGKIYDYNAKKKDDKDYVLTRILRLRGMEQGLNKGNGVDSYKRCIYIHGTSDENMIGQPYSRGCIRMRSRDLIDLYEVVEPGDFVYIRA